MPTLTVKPSSRRTRRRIVCAAVSGGPNSASVPVMSRNASSMEYTSAAGTMRRSVQITRRDMSP